MYTYGDVQKAIWTLVDDVNMLLALANGTRTV